MRNHMSIIIPVLLALVCCAWAQGEIEAEIDSDGLTRELGAKLTEYKRMLPRYTIMGEEGPESLPSGVDGDLDPWMQYGLFLAVYAVAPLVFGLSYFVVFVFFLLCRFCCNCCGGRTHKGNPFTKGQVWCVRCCVFIPAVIGVAFIAGGLGGNVYFTDSFILLFNYTDSRIVMIQQDVSYLEVTMAELLGMFNQTGDDSPYAMANDALQTGRDMIQEASDVVMPYNDLRQYATYIFLSAIGALLLAFIVFSIIKWGKLTFIVTLLFWIMMIFAWIIGAVFLILSITMGDACYELDRALDPEYPGETVFDMLLTCIDPAIIDEFLNQTEMVVDGAVMLLDIEAQALVALGVPFPHENITRSNYEAAREDFFDPAYENPSDEQITTTLTAARSHYHTLDKLPPVKAKINYLGKCVFLSDTLTGLRNILCGDFVMGIDLMTAGLVGPALLSFILIPCGIKAGKRFLKKYAKGKKEDPTLTPKPDDVDDEDVPPDTKGRRPKPVPQPSYSDRSQSSVSSQSGDEGQEDAAAAPPPYTTHMPAGKTDKNIPAPQVQFEYGQSQPMMPATRTSVYYAPQQANTVPINYEMGQVYQDPATVYPATGYVQGGYPMDASMFQPTAAAPVGMQSYGYDPMMAYGANSMGPGVVAGGDMPMYAYDPTMQYAGPSAPAMTVADVDLIDAEIDKVQAGQ